MNKPETSDLSFTLIPDSPSIGLENMKCQEMKNASLQCFGNYFSIVCVYYVLLCVCPRCCCQIISVRDHSFGLIWV